MTFNMSGKTKAEFHKFLEEIAKNAHTVLQLYPHDKLVDMFKHEISGDPKSIPTYLPSPGSAVRPSVCSSPWPRAP